MAGKGSQRCSSLLQDVVIALRSLQLRCSLGGIGGAACWCHVVDTGALDSKQVGAGVDGACKHGFIAEFSTAVLRR